MFISKKMIFLCAGLSLASACTDTSLGPVNLVNPIEWETERDMPSISITLDGKKYEVRRTEVTSYNRKTSERVGVREEWAIVDVNGEELSCIRANAESCQRALDGETSERVSH